MAGGAIALLSEPARHRRFAAAARQGAVERFAQDRIVARYRALYEKTLAAPAATTAVETRA
jgi:hypothetical protein